MSDLAFETERATRATLRGDRAPERVWRSSSTLMPSQRSRARPWPLPVTWVGVGSRWASPFMADDVTLPYWLAPDDLRLFVYRIAKWRFPEVRKPGRSNRNFSKPPTIAYHMKAAHDAFHAWLFNDWESDFQMSRLRTIRRFENFPPPWPLSMIRSELRGRDLVDPLPSHFPSHSDVLLEIANAEASA